MSEPKKHHYIPIFYLRAWAGSNGMLCEFSRPYRKLATKWRHPSATGYQEGLYTMPGLPPEHAQFIEKSYMAITDELAARAHRALLAWRDASSELVPDEKIAWARFLYALVIRTPEQIFRLEQKILAELPGMIDEYRLRYPDMRSFSDPEDFNSFKARYIANPLNTSPLNVIGKLLNSERVLTAIGSMKYGIIRLRELAPLTFLTSDRPFIMSDGIGRPDGHIAIPISPKVLFVAEQPNAGVSRYLRSLPARTLVTLANTKVVEQARRYVYGTDPSQRLFVDRRLGAKIPSSPFG